MLKVTGDCKVYNVEAKTSKAGNPFTTASGAIRKKDKEGKWYSEYVNLVAFREAATALGAIAHGSKIEIEGKLDINTWKKDGVKHYRSEVIVNEVTLLEEPFHKRQKEESDEAPF